MNDASETVDADAMYRAGLDLYQQRRYPEAIAAFSKVINIDPTRGEPWAYRALSHILLREQELPLSDLDQALALLALPSDDSGRALRFMLLTFRASALYTMRRYAETIADLEDAASLGVLDANDYLRLAASLFALRQTNRAHAAYSHALQDSAPEQVLPKLWVTAAQTLLEIRDFDASIAATRLALQGQPQQAYAWTIQALALLALKRCQECMESIEQALTLDNRDYYAWGVKADAMRGLKRFEEASEAYHRAWELAALYPKERIHTSWDEMLMRLRIGRVRAAWRAIMAEVNQRLHERHARR